MVLMCSEKSQLDGNLGHASIGYKALFAYLEASNNQHSYVPISEGWDLRIKYASALNATCRSRRFFATSGRRIGVGPDHIQHGDIIIILSNGPWPFVLRQ